MARGTAVWVVTIPGTRELRAAFTVKHECQRFLERRPDEDFAVWRIGDGYYYPDAKPTRLIRDTLEPAWGPGEDPEPGRPS